MSARTHACGGKIVLLQRRASAPGFTSRDRNDLARWSTSGRRAVVWDSDPAPFAMLYDGDLPWASWAVSRQDGGVLLWDCVSLEDLGRFTCMVDALAALGGICAEVPSNVVQLPLARLRPDPCGQVGAQHPRL